MSHHGSLGCMSRTVRIIDSDGISRSSLSRLSRISYGNKLITVSTACQLSHERVLRCSTTQRSCNDERVLRCSSGPRFGIPVRLGIPLRLACHGREGASLQKLKLRLPVHGACWGILLPAMRANARQARSQMRAKAFGMLISWLHLRSYRPLGGALLQDVRCGQGPTWPKLLASPC